MSCGQWEMISVGLAFLASLFFCGMNCTCGEMLLRVIEDYPTPLYDATHLNR